MFFGSSRSRLGQNSSPALKNSESSGNVKNTNNAPSQDISHPGHGVTTGPLNQDRSDKHMEARNSSTQKIKVMLWQMNISRHIILSKIKVYCIM